MFKVCLDGFTGSNVENVAWLLEGCGRYLLRSDSTHEPFAKMVRTEFIHIYLGIESSPVGVDETKTSYAAFRPTAVAPFGERLLPGEQRSGVIQHPPVDPFALVQPPRACSSRRETANGYGAFYQASRLRCPYQALD